MIQRIWTDEEDNYLKENFGHTSYRKMAKYLNCSTKAITNRVKKLGIEFEKKAVRNWTSEEIEYLKENINKINISEIQRELNIDYYQIMDKLDELGLEYISNRWTKEEEKKLKELAPKYHTSEIAKLLKRTECSIIDKAKKMGIDYTISGRIFTDEELEYIKANWGIISVSDIARNLKASRSMIETQANKLGLPKLGHLNYKWTDEKIEKLRNLSKNKTITELASIFKTTNNAISNVACENNIELINSRDWTDEEISLLKEYAKTMDSSQIANKMNKSIKTVRSQAKVQNIEISENQNYTNSNWTDEEETLLSDLWGNKSIDLIAKKLNRTVSSLQNKTYELNLGSQIDNNYDGLTISTICDLFNVSYNTVSINWVALGLKLNKRKISKVTSYFYVEINDLFEFLGANQNIWDSRNLEENILGKEPEWLKQKRISDRNVPIGELKLKDLTKQQLINAKQTILEQYLDEDTPKQLIKKQNRKNGD